MSHPISTANPLTLDPNAPNAGAPSPNAPMPAHQQPVVYGGASDGIEIVNPMNSAVHSGGIPPAVAASGAGGTWAAAAPSVSAQDPWDRKDIKFPRVVRTSRSGCQNYCVSFLFYVLLALDLCLGMAVVAGADSKTLSNNVFGAMSLKKDFLLTVVGVAVGFGYTWTLAIAALGQGAMLVTAIIQPVLFVVTGLLALHHLDYKPAMAIAVPMFTFGGVRFLGAVCQQKAIRGSSKLLEHSATFLTTHRSGMMAAVVCSLITVSIAGLNLVFFIAANEYGSSSDTPVWVRLFKYINGFVMMLALLCFQSIATGVTGTVCGAYWFAANKEAALPVGACKALVFAVKATGTYLLAGIAVSWVEWIRKLIQPSWRTLCNPFMWLMCGVAFLMRDAVALMAYTPSFMGISGEAFLSSVQKSSKLMSEAFDDFSSRSFTTTLLTRATYAVGVVAGIWAWLVMGDELKDGRVSDFKWYAALGLLLLFLMAVSDSRMTLTVIIIAGNFHVDDTKLIPFAIACLMAALVKNLLNAIVGVLINTNDAFTMAYAFDKWAGEASPGTADMAAAVLSSAKASEDALWTCVPRAIRNEVEPFIKAAKRNAKQNLRQSRKSVKQTLSHHGVTNTSTMVSHVKRNVGEVTAGVREGLGMSQQRQQQSAPVAAPAPALPQPASYPQAPPSQEGNPAALPAAEATTHAHAAPGSGWFDSPWQQSQLAWWDGTRWSGDTMPKPPQ